MDLALFLSATALGVTNHAFFNRYEPRNANTPFLFLVAEPVALLLFLDKLISPGRLMWTYFICLCSLSLSIVAYRLSPFHPLARFPGPALGKITKLRGLLIAASGYQYLFHKKLHDRYGAYVRTGPNEISVIDPAAVSEMLNFGGLDKGKSYEGGRHKSAPPTIVGLAGEAHAAKRRVWNRAFTSAALREYEPLIAKRASQLIACLGGQNGVVDTSG